MVRDVIDVQEAAVKKSYRPVRRTVAGKGSAEAAAEPSDARLSSIERSIEALAEEQGKRMTKLEAMVRSLSEQTTHALLLQAGVLTAGLTPRHK